LTGAQPLAQSWTTRQKASTNAVAPGSARTLIESHHACASGIDPNERDDNLPRSHAYLRDLPHGSPRIFHIVAHRTQYGGATATLQCKHA